MDLTGDLAKSLLAVHGYFALHITHRKGKAGLQEFRCIADQSEIVMHILQFIVSLGSFFFEDSLELLLLLKVFFLGRNCCFIGDNLAI